MQGNDHVSSPSRRNGNNNNNNNNHDDDRPSANTVFGGPSGFKLDIKQSLPTTTTISTRKDPGKPGTASYPAGTNAYQSTDDDVDDDNNGNGDAPFELFVARSSNRNRSSDDATSISSFSFHAAGSSVRTKKVTSYRSTRDHFSQEPFERFSAHKVRERKINDAGDGMGAGGGQRRKMLKHRLPVKEYGPGNGVWPRRNVPTPSSSSSSPLPSRSKSMKNLRSSQPATSSSSSAALGKAASESPVAMATISDRQSYQVDVGLFHGVTVAGGGKRLSVMAPVVPKTVRQLEKDNFRSAFSALTDADATSAQRGTLFIDDVREAMANDDGFRSRFMGTIFWPALKRRDWTSITSRLKSFSSNGASSEITFEGFYNFLRSWYVEGNVDNMRVRKRGDAAGAAAESGGLRKEATVFKVGELVECRAYNSAFWLPGVITFASDSRSSYQVTYDLVTAWRSDPHDLREAMSSGVDVFSAGLQMESRAGDPLVLSGGADDEEEDDNDNDDDDDDGDNDEGDDDDATDQLSAMNIDSEEEDDDHAGSDAGQSGRFKKRQLTESAGKKLTDEREVTEFIWDLLARQLGSSDEFPRLQKSDILQSITAATEEPSNGGGSSLLRFMVIRSAAVLSLVTMKSISDVFAVIDDGIDFEEVNGSNEGGGTRQAPPPTDISKVAFVEFFLHISDILRYNHVKV